MVNTARMAVGTEQRDNGDTQLREKQSGNSADTQLHGNNGRPLPQGEKGVTRKVSSGKALLTSSLLSPLSCSLHLGRKAVQK
jgi:hypothetical protein